MAKRPSASGREREIAAARSAALKKTFDELTIEERGLLTMQELTTAMDRQHRKAARAKARKRFARGRWPFKCDSMGVNPEQCEEAEQKMAEGGVRVEYCRKTGAPIIESEGQYKKMRRVAGLKHYSSFTE